MKKYGLLFCILLFFCSTLPASINYTEGLIIKTKPKTLKGKRMRLTDTLSEKVWKGEKGRNVLKIDLGEIQKFNTVRFKVKKDITFTEIKLTSICT